MIRWAGVGMGAVWLLILLAVVIALLVVIAVRLFTMQSWRSTRHVPPMPGHAPGGAPFGAVPPGAAPPGAVPPGAAPPGAAPPGSPVDQFPASLSRAREILDERLARGEITPDQYRELRRTLEQQ